MTMRRITFLLLAFFLTPLFGGGFSLSELASPGLGSAGVGQTTAALDASTAYFNPAGMPELCRSEFLVGGQVMIEDIWFEQFYDTPFSGPNGSQAGYTLPQGAIYIVLDSCSFLNIGLSINSPFWSSISHDKDWTGRYYVQKMVLTTVDFTPTIGAKLTSWLSIGGGFIIEYSGIYMNLALNPTFAGQSDDGLGKYKYNNWGYGYLAGFLLKPTKRLRIGGTYRSKICHNYHLRSAFRPDNVSFDQEQHYNFPQSAVGSIHYQFNSCWAVMIDGGWENYQNFNTRFVSTLDDSTVTTDRNWHDTYHVGIAVHCTPCPRFLLQCGFAYDTTPTKKGHHTPEFPISEIYRFGVGWMFACNDCEAVGMAFEFADYKKARMRNDLVTGQFKVNHRIYISANWSRRF